MAFSSRLKAGQLALDGTVQELGALLGGYGEVLLKNMSAANPVYVGPQVDPDSGDALSSANGFEVDPKSAIPLSETLTGAKLYVKGTAGQRVCFLAAGV